MNVYNIAAESVSDRFIAGMESEYGAAGRQWLRQLPQLLSSLCARWELELTDPIPRHGYLSLVWQVTFKSETLALKVTIPSPTFAREISGLIAWDGHGMVRLDRFDVEAGAALLQWLDSSISLADVPINEAIEIAGGMLRITPAAEQISASRYENALIEAQAACQRWFEHNHELGNPLSPTAIRAGEAAIARINQKPDSDLPWLVNHDLHYENVIRDGDKNWVCIDPKPVIGTPEYALAPLIWRRYRDPKDAIERVQQLRSIVANLDEPLVLDWLLVRTIQYLFWSLGAGLTTDPAICRELIGYLAASEPHFRQRSSGR